MIIVAQRVSTIMHADQIVVLDDGVVVGIGTHAELLRDLRDLREIVDSQLGEEAARRMIGGRRRRTRLRGPGPRRRAEQGPSGTLRRLLARLAPERGAAPARARDGVASVGFVVAGPKILGDATNILFEGVVGKLLPAGTTKAEAVARLRAEGHGQLARLVSHLHVTPGAGIDFGALGRVLGLAALVYLVSAALQLRPGLHAGGHRPAHDVRLRTDVEDKLEPAAAALLRQPSRTATSSAGSPTTSTTSPRACSRR